MDIAKNAQNFKQESLANFQALSFAKESIPVAGCAAEENPWVLSRCQKKAYNDRSEVVPQAMSSEESVAPVSTTQISYSTL